MNTKPLVIALSLAGFCAMPAYAAPADLTATEYYNAQLKHYFFTTSAAEAGFVDNGGAGAGWVRTGRTFAVWSRRDDVPGDATAVSRFYSSGANSHFFTASAGEAQSLRSLQNAAATDKSFSGWRDEGTAFFVASPGNGNCAAGTTAVSRLYNDGFKSGEGSNHRFVTDDDLKTSMQDDKWIAEGIAFCEQAKSGFVGLNLPPVAARPTVALTPGTFTGTVLTKIESAGAAEVKSAVSLSLIIDAAGNVTATGGGCRFTGSVGANNDAVRKGVFTASGCSDLRLNGAYARSTIELYSPNVMAVRLRQGDGANEVSISGVLTNGVNIAPTPTPGPTAGPTPSPSPTPSPGTPGTIAPALYVGSAEWSRRVKTTTATGNSESLSATSTQLTLTISSDGSVQGQGFGCAFSGKLSVTNAALGTLGGNITLAGCSDAQYNATYAAVVTAENGGAIEWEMEKETEAAGTNTKLKVKGRLAQSVSVNPTPPPTPGPTAAPTPAPTPGPTAAPTPAPTPGPTPPAGAAAASYSGNATWSRTTKASGGGSASDVSSATTTALRITIAADGSVSGGGYGCVASGKLSNATTGNVTLNGCTDAIFNANYAAIVTAENGGAIEWEMEHESQAGTANTKLKVKGRLAKQ
jgi:Repeat of unknown function (DUF5648)